MLTTQHNELQSEASDCEQWSFLQPLTIDTLLRYKLYFDFYLFNLKGFYVALSLLNSDFITLKNFDLMYGNGDGNGMASVSIIQFIDCYLVIE